MSGNDYELLSAYIDEVLTSAERAELEVRLQSEPQLRQELATLHQTVTLVRDLPALKAPRNFMLTPAMVRQALPFPLTATFSALSTAAAILLFAFGGYFLLQSNSTMVQPVGETISVSTSAENQVAVVPTVLREAAPTASSVALATVTDTDDRQTQPSSIVGNAQDSASFPTPTALATPLLQQLESEAVEEGLVPDAGGGGANLEFYADGTSLADDETSAGELADADSEDPATLDESTFGLESGEFAGRDANDAPGAAAFPQDNGPTFRVAPPNVTETSVDAVSSEAAVAQAPAPSAPSEATRGDGQEEERNEVAEPPPEPAAEVDIQVTESSITISLGLLVGGALLLGVAIFTTAIRRRRLAQ